MTSFKLISDLPAGPTNLVGTELIEVQNGGGAGASQQTTVGHILALALKSLNRTAVLTANYTLLSSDLAVFDTTAASYTALLPNAPADGTVCAVKLIAQGGANTVTCTSQGSDTINVVSGGNTTVLALLGQSVILLYQASTRVWTKISDGYTLASLDSRYDTAGAAATVQASAQTYTDARTGQVLGVNPQTGAYALVLSDKGKDIQVNSATAVNLTIPLNALVAFPIGTLIPFSQLGAGTVTAVGVSGVTIEAAFGAATTAAYDGRVLEKIAADTWRVW